METLITLEEFGTMYQPAKESFCLTYGAKIIIEGLTSEQAQQALLTLAKLQNKGASRTAQESIDAGREVSRLLGY